MESIFLTNRFIRNYLQLFNENKWKDVIKYTLIYGIQSLQCHYNLTHLSTQKLEEIIRNSNFIITAEDMEHAETNKLRALKSNAEYLTSEMGIDPLDNNGVYNPFYEAQPSRTHPQAGDETPQDNNKSNGNNNDDDDEFDEVVKVNMGPSATSVRNSRNNRNNNRIQRNRNNRNNNHHHNMSNANNNNNNNRNILENTHVNEPKSNGAQTILGEYVPTDTFNKHKSTLMEYLDAPAPIKSQLNPLDPDAGVQPEWFVQHDRIPNVQPLRPPRKPSNPAPSQFKPPLSTSHHKHGTRPKGKPKTGITETNAEPSRPPPPPAPARPKRTPIKSQVDADREAYKNHKTRKTPAKIAEEFYDGDVIEHFTDKSDSYPSYTYEMDDYDEFQDYEGNYTNENQNSNGENAASEYHSEEEIPPELTHTVRRASSHPSPYVPQPSAPLATSPHIQIHAPGAQIYTAQPLSNTQPYTSPYNDPQHTQSQNNGTQPHNSSPQIPNMHPQHPQHPQSALPQNAPLHPQNISQPQNDPQPLHSHPYHAQSHHTQPHPHSQPLPHQLPQAQQPDSQYVQAPYSLSKTYHGTTQPYYTAPYSVSPPFAPQASSQPSNSSSQPIYHPPPPHHQSSPQDPHYNPHGQHHPSAPSQYQPLVEKQASPQYPHPFQHYPQHSPPIQHLTRENVNPHTQAFPPHAHSASDEQPQTTSSNQHTPRAPSPHAPAQHFSHPANQYTQTQPSQGTQTYELPLAQAPQTHQATQTPVHQPTQTDPLPSYSSPPILPSSSSQTEPRRVHMEEQASSPPTARSTSFADQPHISAIPSFVTPAPSSAKPAAPSSSTRMAWSYHSEPTPNAASQRAPAYETPHSFPPTAPPSHHHTSSHYEPVLSSPDNSPTTSPDNSPHSSPASSRSSTPPLTQTYPLPKARQRSHSHSELFHTTHGRHRTTPHKPTAPSTRAHQTPQTKFSQPYRPRPPSPTPSHSSVEWVTLEGETEPSDTGSQIETPSRRNDPHAHEFHSGGGGAAHVAPTFHGGAQGISVVMAHDTTHERSHGMAHDITHEMTQEMTQKEITDESIESSGMEIGASESASPPIVHSHTHTHKHYFYTGDKPKAQDLVFPSTSATNDLQGWNFDQITSQSDTDTKTRTRVKGKKRESSSSRRHSKSTLSRTTTAPLSSSARTAPPPSGSASASHSVPNPLSASLPARTSTPAASLGSHHHTASYIAHHHSETGVGDADVHADEGEDFGRGLDMWKGSTMEIAARLRQAEQERRELQKQLLNASNSSRSNSNSK